MLTTRIEPTTPCSQSRCANRTALRPEMVRSFAKPSAKIRVYGETAKGFRGENRLNGHCRSLAVRSSGVLDAGFLWCDLFSQSILLHKMEEKDSISFVCISEKERFSVSSAWNNCFKRMKQLFQAHETTVSNAWNSEIAAFWNEEVFRCFWFPAYYVGK